MISHIASNGVRASISVNEGLLSLKYDVRCNRDEFLLGKLLLKKSDSFCEDLLASKFIFVGADDANSYKEYKSILNDIWDRVIWYDYRDSTHVALDILRQCRCYFKRSVQKIHPGVYPIDFCALSAYYQPNTKRTISVACMFDDSLPDRQVRRRNLLKIMRKNEHRFASVTYGTNSGTIVRSGISEGVDDLLNYWITLASSKIVFTAFPQNWDGDSRTWEAFASGALVFRDVTKIHSPHPLIPDKHYISYDASNIQSIETAMNKAAYFLKHDEERNKIAQSGYNHVKRHHQATNRVSYMLNIVQPSML